MAQSAGSPSDRRFSHFRCEEAEVTNVNRKTWTVDVTTKHSSKPVNDIAVLVPYHHYSGGEGIHHLPEVGAICMLGWPSDNTPPFIMGYKPAASVLGEDSVEGDPQTPSPEGGSSEDVSFRSNRPDLQPGDIAFTTRDENFIILRRGGVVQIGSTPVAQRLYIPILNYMKDFCENYEMSAFGGDVTWTVERQESDPSGNAPASYVFHMNEFAQDKKASVRIQHFPLQAPGGGSKAAWDIVVAQQGIDRDSGAAENKTYSMQVLMDGTKTEFIGANRTVAVDGDDSLTVGGSRTVTVGGDETHNVTGSLTMSAGPKAILSAAQVALGGSAAIEPIVLGNMLQAFLAACIWDVIPAPDGTMKAVGPPKNMPQFASTVLSKVVKST